MRVYVFLWVYLGLGLNGNYKLLQTDAPLHNDIMLTLM